MKMSCSIVKMPKKEIKQGQKQLVFAPSSLILTNYFLPVN